MCALYEFISSDHRPISFNVTCTIKPISETSYVKMYQGSLGGYFHKNAGSNINNLTDETLKEESLRLELSEQQRY